MKVDRVADHTPQSIDDARREAAVLAPIITRDEEAHILFTKRADHLGEHPGQMSFPGGGREPSDETLIDTALREANEEIGLRREEVEIVGQLDDITTVTDYAVTPFVGRIPDREYVPDEREVAEIAVLSVADLIDKSNYENEQRDHPRYGDIIVHFFHVDDYTVWGATGRILVQLLELTTDWQAPDRIDRVLDTDPDL
ncbi:MAG: CoA pyrophosphatase [Halobacteriales archaeon]